MPIEPRLIEVMDDAMVDVYRRLTPAQRLRIADDMWSSARQMLLNILRQQHPEWTDQQIKREVARRLSHGAC